MARLTGFSKFVITVLILAIIFLGGRWVLNNTSVGQNLKEQAEAAKQEAAAAQDNNTTASNGSSSSNTGGAATSGSRAADDDVLRVQLVTWGGYAPGLYFNEGAVANTRSRFYKDYGVKVDFKVENDLINALNAWTAGEYDVLVQTMDAFPLYTAPDDINSFGPKAFMQCDWSRGGDAIIVKRGINNINDLKGKTIAVAVPSPAQTLLITSLEAAGLKYSDVKVIKTADNLKAAELFRSDDVDAAVVWSPDDVLATRDVPGSKILLTTKEQSNIIADIFFASDDYIRKNKNKINAFYEGWMKAVAELEANPSNQDKAAKYLAELNGISPVDAKGMMANVHWTSHGDNMNFFGLNPSYKGQKGNDLYGKMSRKFVETGDADKVAPSFRSVIYTGAIQAADANLKGNKYRAESAPVFKPTTSADRTAPAIAVKPISINFSTGQSALTENARTIIDIQFADVAKAFANTKVRIEGNTDNTGSRATNMALSQKRAESVASYLKQQYGMDRNRFVIIGNGPDKPVPGCESNATTECKAKNRRTEFQIIMAQ
jgi:NitT/TauT family transport system substrate-binding protein